MLKSLGINKTRSQLPPLVPSSCATNEVGTAQNLVQHHEVTDSVKKTAYIRRPAAVSLQSPVIRSRAGIRDTDQSITFVRGRASRNHSIHNNFIMEIQESSRRTDSGRSLAIEKYEPQILVVVVDASRELQLAPLKYALEISEPGDKLYLLGVLHQVQNPMGYKQKADPGYHFNGTNHTVILGEQRKTAAVFHKCMNDPELQELFASKQVNPVVQIAPGPDRKVVTARQALELRAKWVILEEHLKKDKCYLMEHLDCNLVLMKPKNQKVFIRLQQDLNEGNLSDVDDFGLLPPRKNSVTEHKRNRRQPKEARKRGTTRGEDSGLASMNDMSLRDLHESVEINVSKSSSSAHRRQQSPLEGRSERRKLSWTTFVRRVLVTEFFLLSISRVISFYVSNHTAPLSTSCH